MPENLDYQQIQHLINPSNEGQDFGANDYKTIEVETSEGPVCLGLTIDKDPKRRPYTLQQGIKITFFNLNDALNTTGIHPEDLGSDIEIDETVGAVGKNEEALFAIYYDKESGTIGFDLGNRLEQTAWGAEIISLVNGDSQPIRVSHGTLVYLFDPICGWEVSRETPESERDTAKQLLQSIQENSIYNLNIDPLP